MQYPIYTALVYPTLSLHVKSVSIDAHLFFHVCVFQEVFVCVCVFSRTGSPFQYTVGKPATGGTHRVEFGGPGIEGGSLGTKGKHPRYPLKNFVNNLYN